MENPQKNPQAGAWRTKLTQDDKDVICRRCRALSSWGRLYQLVTTLNTGHWNRGPAEQAGKTWPSAPGWDHVVRGFKHSLPIAEANYLEFFDERHQVGKIHEAAVVRRNEQHPGMPYPQYMKEHLTPQQGVTYMADHDRDQCKIRFSNGRLVLPAAFPADVRARVIQHSQQAQEEDEPQVAGQPKDKPKHRVIFVADEHDIYITIKQEGRIQHSSFLRGRPAFMAGYLTLREFNATDNSFKITKIKGKSGHYRPDVDQFVVFLWALEHMLPLNGVQASYAVMDNGTKGMQKVDAFELLEQNRGRVIPKDATDDLRFQLGIASESPSTSLRQREIAANEAEAEGEAPAEVRPGHVAAGGDEEAALPAGVGGRRRQGCCGCCGCVIM